MKSPIKYSSIPKFIVSVLPLGSICALLIVALFLITIGEASLAQKGLIIIGIPLILASLFALKMPKLFSEDEMDYFPSFNVISVKFSNLVLLFIVTYIFSIYILVLQEIRSIGYFLLVGLMAGIIVLEIILPGQQNWMKDIILLQIALLFLDISLGCTLKYPMIILGTDIFYHLHYIKTIIESGHVTNNLGGFYQYFPLFHIYDIMGLFFSGMNLKDIYFILNEVAFTISIILVYLIAKCTTLQQKPSLLTALIYSFSRPAIDGGMYVVTRTMAYLICCLILYLLIQGKIDIRFRVITIFLIIPAILIHQTTLIVYSSIFILLLIIELILHEPRHFRIHYIILFIVCFMSYWIFFCYPFFTSIVSNAALTQADPVSIPEEMKASSLGSNIISYLDYDIIIFMFILGAMFLLNQNKGGPNSVKHTLTAGSLVMLPLYIPAIAQLLSSMLGYRIPLLVSPFVALISGAGFSIFIFKSAKYIGYRRFLPLFSIVLLLSSFVLSLSLSANLIDSDVLSQFLGKNQGYFTQSELDSASFLLNHMAENNFVISDYEMIRFIEGYLGIDGSAFIGSILPNSYFLFRSGEYNSTGKIDFIYKTSRGREIIETLDREKYPYSSFAYIDKNKIYSNKLVDIFRNGY